MKAVAIALTMLATSAQAEFITGNDLLAYMNGTETQQSLAMGYVAGAFDAATGSRICPPPNVTLRQVRDMTRQALERLPAERLASADVFVVGVASNAWPCRQQPRRSDI
jgi:hypothetical protein